MNNEKNTVSELQKLYETISVLVIITISIGLLSEAIDSVGVVPSLTDFKITKQDTFYTNNVELGMGNSTEMNLVEFTIDGRPGTSYIRLQTFDTYDDGKWTLADEKSQEYYGDLISHEVPTNIEFRAWLESFTGEVAPPDMLEEDVMFDDVQIRISFTRNVKGFYPALLKTTELVSETPLEYYPDQQTFFSSQRLNESYSLSATNNKYYDKHLGYVDDTYLSKFWQSIPSGSLSSELTRLTARIDFDSFEDFTRINTVIEYLHDNFDYTNNMTIDYSTLEGDPLYLFLREKEGDDFYFNSALVMIARQLGYPARLVEGYIVDPEASNQEVHSNQRRFFVEIPFENVGWLTFNANPEYDNIRTENVIIQPFLLPVLRAPYAYTTSDESMIQFSAVAFEGDVWVEGANLTLYVDGTAVEYATTNDIGWATFQHNLTEGDHRWYVKAQKEGYREADSTRREITYEIPVPEPDEPDYPGDSDGDSGDDSDDSTQNGGQGESSNGDSGPTSLQSENMFLRPVDSGTQDDSDLFRVEGAPNTEYLRTFVGEGYDSNWNLKYPLYILYENVNQGITGASEKTHIYINPITPMSGFLPSTLSASSLSGSDDVIFHPDQSMYFGQSGTINPYELSYSTRDFSEAFLRRSGIDKSDQYDTPSGILDILRPLANEITRGEDNEFDKVKAIESYLESNFEYTNDFNEAPPETDPVEWFLNNEKKGTHSIFNSAFTLLLRSIDIPARYAEGFFVFPDEPSQIVNQNQQQSWVEVPFLNAGWVQFDATDPYGLHKPEEELPQEIIKKITITEIIQQDEVYIIGNDFTVYGKVTTDNNQLVDGLISKVYLKENKEDTGIFAGEGLVEDGYFNITCNTPYTISVGDYQVDVHTTGNELFNESWSDPPILVISETNLKLSSALRVIAEKPFTLSGTLKKKGSLDPIQTSECTITIPGEEKTVNTDTKGSFTEEFLGIYPGEYEVNVEWTGSEYYLGTNTITTLQSIPLTITPTEITRIIRGEDSTLLGRVHAEELNGDAETVQISMNGLSIGSTVTNDPGNFQFVYGVPNDSNLGEVDITYRLERNQNEFTVQTQTVARTSIDDSTIESVSWKEPFNITASLLDDNGDPLTNMPLTLGYRVAGTSYNRTLATNESGFVSFLFSFDENPETEEIDYSFYFDGVNNYIGSTVKGILLVYTPQSTLPSMSIIIAAAVTFTGTAGLIYFKKPFVSLTPEDIEDEVTPQGPIRLVSIPDETEAPAPITLIGPLRVEIPQLFDGLPPVWGVGEELSINISIPKELDLDTKGELTVQVGEIKETLKFTKKRTLEYKKTFKTPGEYSLNAHYKTKKSNMEGKAQTIITVIDYQDTINTFFHEFYENSIKQFNFTSDLTARELQYNLNQIFPSSISPYLNVVIQSFEEAKYSTHPINRQIYGKFYSALKEIEGSRK